MSDSASAMAATVEMLSARKPFPYMGLLLVLQEEIEQGVGDQPEDKIIEPQRQQPARRGPGRMGEGEQRRGRPRAADHDRDEQRQPEQRPQEVACASPDGKGRDERADHGNAYVAE